MLLLEAHKTKSALAKEEITTVLKDPTVMKTKEALMKVRSRETVIEDPIATYVMIGRRGRGFIAKRRA